MTRLVTEWISEIENTAARRDEEMKNTLGFGYNELAEFTAGLPPGFVNRAAAVYRVTVVPITSGLGIINTFPESVAAIVRTMGFNAFVTDAADVDGLYEASTSGADIVYMADDDRYLAMNLRNSRIDDNNIATAGGFAEILCRRSGDPEGRRMVVLGYGIIGRLMAGYLNDKGAKVTVFDKYPAKLEAAAADGYPVTDKAENLKTFRYIADGTDEGPWISSGVLADGAFMVAPGIPFSLDDEAKSEMVGRYTHDLLEIGTAVMMGLALK